jgi:phosphopantetheinyl transferase
MLVIRPDPEMGLAGRIERRYLSGLGRSNVVVYGWTEDGDAADAILAAELVSGLRQATQSKVDGCSSESVVIRRGRLNEPLLMVSGRSGPGFSLSRSAGRRYGAVADKGFVGCDSALSGEFNEPYPFHLAFTEPELARAGAFCGSVGSGAALLWSLKEAAVKALGTGFHSIDPIEVRIASLTPLGSGYEGRVTARQSLQSWSEPVPDGWLSVAVRPR